MDKLIWLIDASPPASLFENYFIEQQIAIMYQSSWHPLPGLEPWAIVLDWDLIKAQQDSIPFLHENYAVPLVVCSNRRDEEACIIALESGADDCISKPLVASVLLAHINAIYRRIIKQPSHFLCNKMLAFGDWKLYPASRQVFDKNEQELVLSAGEYDLLYIFVQYPQEILNREQLLQLTKSKNLQLFDRRIDIQISRLRKKIESDSNKPLIIVTLRNKGYLFTLPVRCLNL